MALIESGDIKTTSDMALTIKRSVVETGVLEDDFVKYFVPHYRYSPLQRLLHYLRMTSVRIAISTFLDQFPNEPVQFVNIGSGIDTISFWLLQKYKNLTCFDIDFNEQLERKADMMRNAPAFVDLLPDYVDNGEKLVYTERYRMVPANLDDQEQLDALVSKYKLSDEQPVVFLSECAVVYLKADRGNEVIKFASQVTKKPACFVYWEMYRTDDQYGNTMMSRFREHSIEPFGASTYPTLEQQIQRYESNGWDKVVVMDMSELYNNLIPEEDKKRVMETGPHEEIEEIYIVCGHYVLGVCATQPEKIPAVFEKFKKYPPPPPQKTYTTEEILKMIADGSIKNVPVPPLKNDWE